MVRERRERTPIGNCGKEKKAIMLGKVIAAERKEKRTETVHFIKTAERRPRLLKRKKKKSERGNDMLAK